MLTYRIKSAKSSFPEQVDSVMLEYLMQAMADDAEDVQEVAEQVCINRRRRVSALLVRMSECRGVIITCSQQLRKLGEFVIARAVQPVADEVTAAVVPMDIAVAAEAAAPEEGETSSIQAEEMFSSDDPAVVIANKYGRKVLPLLIEHTAFWTVDVR